MTTPQPVVAVYELPKPIWVDLHILGKRFDTRIGPILATVVTPAAGPRATAPPLTGIPAHALRPIHGERPPRLDAYPSNAVNIDPDWATEYAAEYPGGRATALRAIGIELIEDPDRPTHTDTHSAIGNPQLSARYSAQGTAEARIADLVGRNIENWYTRLAEWVTVLTGQDLDHRHQLYSGGLIAPGLRIWHHDRWEPSLWRGTVPTVTPVNLDTWRTTLAHVGACTRPRLEWQLLTEAGRAVSRGYYRRAVIDYATAVEVCLSRMVQDSTLPAKKPGAKSNLHTWSNWLTKHRPESYTVDPNFKELVDILSLARVMGPPRSHEHGTTRECSSSIDLASRTVNRTTPGTGPLPVGRPLDDESVR